MLTKKRAQVTTYIIIGIVLLFIISSFFYLRNKSISDEDILSYSIDDLKPVERYVVQCLESVARQGLTIIGFQGGYIELPEPLYSRPRNYMQTSPNSFKIPLWKIDGATIYPNFRMVEEQLNEYIEDNIEFCVNGLSDLDFIQEFWLRSEPEVRTSLNEEDVSVILELKVETQSEGKRAFYDVFGLRLPVRLRDIISAGATIIERDSIDKFLASSTLNLMALDADNFPMGDLRFSCNRLVWSKREMERTLKEHLTFMMPRVRVAGTNYMPFKEPLEVYRTFEREWSVDRVEIEGLPKDLPLDIYDYMQMYWNFGVDFDNLNIGFSFDENYDMLFKVSPSQGDLVKAVPGRSGSKYLSFLCMNAYHFTYDVMFPVRVSIFDETAFGGDGYVFNLGMPVNIEKNIPTTQTPRFLFMEAWDTDEEFCNRKSSQETLIVVQDRYSEEYLSGVNVKYDCMRYYCELGETTSDYNLPQLITNLPEACANGVYILEKPGYLISRVQETGDFITTSIVPLAEFNYAVIQHGESRPYSGEYTVSIHITSKENEDFEQYLIYPADALLDESDTGYYPSSKLHLINSNRPHTYEVNLYLLHDGNIVGGWVGDWTVNPSDLSKSTVIFYSLEYLDMISHPTPEKVYELYLELEDPNANYRARLAPEFR